MKISVNQRLNYAGKSRHISSELRVETAEWMSDTSQLLWLCSAVGNIKIKSCRFSAVFTVIKLIKCTKDSIKVQVGEQSILGYVGAICNLSAGPLMDYCMLDEHSLNCMLLLTVPWHSGHFKPPRPSSQVPRRRPPPHATHLLLHWFS